MTIDDDRVEAESLEPFAVNFHVVLQRSWLALSEPIDVEDRAQIVEIVVRGEVKRFPDRTFG